MDVNHVVLGTKQTHVETNGANELQSLSQIVQRHDGTDLKMKTFRSTSFIFLEFIYCKKKVSRF